jgi:hypothetical protein
VHSGGTKRPHIGGANKAGVQVREQVVLLGPWSYADMVVLLTSCDCKHLRTWTQLRVDTGSV